VLCLLFVGVVVLGAGLVPPATGGFAIGVLTWVGWLFGVLLLLLAAAEAFELVDLVMQTPIDVSDRPVLDCPLPFVSLHVPICSEPPEVVTQTLLALKALSYERFEVLVIDNNTHDEALWRPIERVCGELGPQFRFFHLPSWPGYKAGALNYALRRTSQEASVVGVIDADYQVVPAFLASLVVHFDDRRVGFVQAPQDYREWEQRYASRMCYWEYWQFFAVSMRLRRQRNAVLMHGTMVLISRAALLRVGGWAEWCLTEDSELGLRLLAAGYRGEYCSLTLGRGLVPFSYRAYLRQRRRWVTGGVQTVRRHWRLFAPRASSLTAAQKLHYLQGWAPWMRDGLLMASVPLAIVLGVVSLCVEEAPVPIGPLGSAVLVIVAYLVVREGIVYRAYLGRPWIDGIGAGLAIFGMMPTVGLAWLRGWVKIPLAFQRTPKQPQPRTRCVLAVVGPLVVGTIVIAIASGILARFGSGGMRAGMGLAAYGIICLACVCAELVDRD